MQELINHINNSIEKAKNNQSNLSHEILSYDGMSSYKVRHLFNNLANHPSFKKYLEVGIYKGATSSAVIFNNNIEAILIDNWSQFSSDFNVTGTNNIFRDTKQQCLFNLNNANSLEVNGIYFVKLAIDNQTYIYKIMKSN